MEEYMKLLMEQIRCRKAHPYIRKEMQGHIEDQIAENMQSGMSREEAERTAVKDMGSPVEVGIALDRIHRPQIAWGMLGLMALISIAAIIIHGIINRQIGEYPLTSSQIESVAIGSSHFAIYTIIGFISMMIVYHIDYSVLARFAKIIAGAMIVIGVYSLFNGITVGGVPSWASVAGIKVSLYAMMLLYVPFYGAVIYKYHGQGYGALAKSIIWMLLPVFVAFRLPNLSLAMILLVSMSVVLTVAIVHDWYQVSKRKVIAILWVCELGLPIIGLAITYFGGMLADYQTARIQAFLTSNGEANYITDLLRKNLAASHFIGNRGESWIGMPGYNSDFILSYVMSTYGILIGAVICCILAVLIIKIFSISFQQKNQLGMCMGCGCGMILLLNAVINVGENLGLLPRTQSFLPFFSAGGSCIIACYMLMGIILSVYRYKNIYPANVSTKLPKIDIRISL